MYAALLPHAEELLPLYTSKSMKIGIDLPRLKAAHQVLSAAFFLDKRGAYFGQFDSAEAISMIESVDKNFVEAREQLTKDNAEVPFTTRHKVAYSFRVMCSHVRSKLKRWTKGADVVPP